MWPISSSVPFRCVPEALLRARLAVQESSAIRDEVTSRLLLLLDLLLDGDRHDEATVVYEDALRQDDAQLQLRSTPARRLVRVRTLLGLGQTDLAVAELYAIVDASPHFDDAHILLNELIR